MLSRAQEARVRAILWSGPPGPVETYCLEHLATAAKLPPGHMSDPRSSSEPSMRGATTGDASAETHPRLGSAGSPDVAGPYVMTDRRAFIGTFAGLLAVPFAGEAQQAGRVEPAEGHSPPP